MQKLTPKRAKYCLCEHAFFWLSLNMVLHLVLRLKYRIFQFDMQEDFCAVIANFVQYLNVLNLITENLNFDGYSKLLICFFAILWVPILVEKRSSMEQELEIFCIIFFLKLFSLWLFLFNSSLENVSNFFQPIASLLQNMCLQNIFHWGKNCPFTVVFFVIEECGL